MHDALDIVFDDNVPQPVLEPQQPQLPLPVSAPRPDPPTPSFDRLLSLGSGHSVHDALDIVFDDGVAEDVMASWVVETAADASARSPSSTPSSPRFRTQQAAQASAASASGRAQKQGQHGVNGLQVMRSPHTGTTFTLGSQQKAGPWGGFW